MTIPPTDPSPDLRRAFRRGVLTALPFLIVVGPFGLLFGLVATDAGMTMLQAMAFSVGVIAGASQFAAVQLIQDGAPLAIVILTALAVNLRLAMYSAALTPHLGGAPLSWRAFAAYLLMDQNFVAGLAEFQRTPERPAQEKAAFFIGMGLGLGLPWYAVTWVGIVFGRAIPPEYALDFAVPITFLATISPLLRSPAHVAAAATSVGVTLALWWMPYSTGLLVAGVVAMAVGAATETLLSRSKRA